ncbi:aminotransferase class V-fold PLP-dependent enzyme [Bdellovibrio svalbardensis]|uniref:Aminotransferase class V-fold PLP-dependent enzyme n=1 Tax=Bdellovibrio svalbardensis TaxID=2972972 RepID=A0ABT6DJS7_9BACT|nr:aminotransferase class V-fold PLP-dependent enzyme [Bdellovibrio svalbardensis]MDG0817124.1 aminotransferase class V-fold PLP-dependent enzyme [Bdellovibrio svalbardensis]
MTELKLLEFRKGLPFLQGQCFLNYAATCPVPTSSIKVMQDEIGLMQEPLGKHFYQSLNKVEMIRKELARFLGAHAGEIAFVQNTSSAVSTIALALNLQSGDKVLVPDNEFPSNYYPWKNLERFGVELVPFSIKKDQTITDALSGLDLNNVKVISVSAVSFETGKRIDLKEFADFCRRNKVYSCVDAIQAIGNTPINCREMGFDFLASGSQKWLLGSVGCGFIYARTELLETLFVPMVGWTSHRYPEYFDLTKLEFSNEMTRFEPGLPNYVPILGMGESLRLINDFGIDKVHAQIQGHLRFLNEKLTALNLELLTGEKDLTAGILCFRIPQKVDHRKVHEFFEKKKISVTVRGDYVRVSPHFFTLHSELEFFVKSVAELIEKPLPQAHTVTAKSAVSTSLQEPVIINGATGNLGMLVAKQFLAHDQAIFLLGRNEPKMTAFLHNLSAKEKALIAGSALVDFTSEGWLQKLKSQMPAIKYSGLINASGGLTVDLLENQNEKQIREIFEVQFFAPLQLIQTYLKEWKSNSPLGVLNILSSSGRCGYPLLSTYASSHAALWTLTESLQREQAEHVPFMTYVAQSQHSPLQKDMGRTSLRYYQIGKSFDYAIPEDVAIDVVNQFFEGESHKADFNLKLKLWINAIAPDFFSKQIAKAWRR